MRIEAVIVCVDYADFLFYTLPYTLRAWDDVVVVTTPKDQETASVCKYHGVRCHATDVFYKGGPFNKGAAINEGLSQLARTDWCLIQDADILVVPQTKQRWGSLDPGKLYGADRMNCDGIETLRACEQYGNWGRLTPIRRITIGYETPPIGYFQLWHSSQIPCGPWYEGNYGYADRCDLIFARRFERREFLNTFVVHLDNGCHVGGKNWAGRRSARFVDQFGVDLNAV